jgi:choline dehydrogenase-like flavoprotein
VWDVSGLFCADGSVFPTPSGANPMITIYGVAYLTAQGIASKWKQHQQQQQQQQEPASAHRHPSCEQAASV